LVASVAEALDRTAEDAAHRALAERIAAAFRGAFVAADGIIHGDTQCAYALALAFDLLPAADRTHAAALLAERVRERDVHIATGFVGTPYMCATLADHGYLDLAYQLLRNDSYPSWGYSIRHGATTVWERWDGWTDAGGFQTPAMNSFNHYAYGAIGDWMARVVAGLDTHPDHPGYQHLRLAPRPGGGLTWARAALLTPHGRASCHWELEPCGALTLTVEVPTNATAEVIVPTGVPDR
ncbi:MAG TPA: alpha-L-rhamnosidase, partial [Armatimonadetes bacterium]|nr:alpha-L-rhamnosidase [Armatimonadota bacterium]